MEAPIALAFGAGLVATMNPCGFAMLPAYLSYFMGLGGEEEEGRVLALRRALLVGAVISAAFLLIFGLFGILITAGFRAVIDWIPWIAILVGVAIVILGIAMLRGYELTVRLPKAKRAAKGKGLRQIFGFGLSYATASLSCTLPVFLSVVATQVTTTNFFSGILTFLVYGFGMSLMLVSITVVLALGKQSLVGRIRSSVQYINKIAGVVLVIAGAYIIWFWTTDLTSGANQLGRSQGVTRFVDTLSQNATEFLGNNIALIGIVLGGLIVGTIAYVFLSKGDGGTGDGPERTKAQKRVRLVSTLAIVGLFGFTGSLFVQGNDRPTIVALEDGSFVLRGPPAPTDTFALFDGTGATFADYSGRPLVVNFWASWCPSCVAELSNAFVPIQERFGDRVSFLGVDLQDTRGDALKLIEETGVQFDLAEDPDGDLYRAFGGLGMPFTVIISPAGEILDEHNGPLTEGQLEDKILELLLSGPAPADDGTLASPPSTTPTPHPPPAPSADVIVEPDVVLPSSLAQVTGRWNTDFTRRTIDDLSELKVGIPSSDPRDLIPPLDNPEFETVTDASEWLDAREPGVLFEVDGLARFYPLRILTFHEVANDDFNGQPVVVTFCPLCNTAVVFNPVVNGQTLRFGVSGLLRNSDLVMWDSTTETLWQQITGEAIVGELAGTQLELLGASVIRWGDFQDNFANGDVLSRQTGFSRSYGQNPYTGYSSSQRPFLFDGEIDDRFPPLDRVVGVTVNGIDKAYPFRLISGVGAVNDVVAEIPIIVLWGAEDTADALDTSRIVEGKSIGTGIAYNATVDGQVLTFTALGNDLFSDRETGTTWNLLGRALDGPLAGSQLETAVHRNDFWFAWAAFNPEDAVYGETG